MLKLSRLQSFFSLRESDNTVLGNSQNLIGVVYGVVVAFMIILSWQNYTNLNQTLIDESASLLAMWRDSRFFNDKDQKKIETAIINYAKSVTDYEWINFKQKNKASIHNPEYLKLWESIHGLEIHTPLQKALLYSFIDDLNQVSKIRRHRIIDLNIKTSPVMWIFLFIGGAYLIFITFLYQKTHHRLINFVWMSQFTIIIYTFYLIWSYNDPHHSNYLKSSKKGMDMLIYTITTTPKNM